MSTPMGLVLATALSLTAMPAAPAPQPVAIHIESNRARLTRKAGQSTYTGDVVLTRGGLTLTGETLTVTHMNDRAKLRAVLAGAPAHIDKQPDRSGDDVITGHADKIVYTNADATITLRGDALVVRGSDRITGQRIRHNLDTGATEAEGGAESGGKSRVHITITPQSAGDNGGGP